MNKWLCLTAPLMMIAGDILAASGEEAGRPEAAANARVMPTSALDSSHLVDTIIGLVAVLALMLALAWLVRRFVSMPGVGKGQVQVLGGASLGPRERAVVVSVEGQRLLLGVAPGRVQMLHVLGAEPQPEAPGEDQDFAKELEKAGQGEQA